MDASRIGNVAGAVLVGGASSRMGRDKSHLPVAGVPCAVRVARVLASVFEDVLLVGGDPPAEAPGRRVADGDGPVCALRGLVAALEHADAERVCVVATDMPAVTPTLVTGLVAWPLHDAVVPRDAHSPHPLCAIYSVERVLPVARDALAREALALRGVLDAVDTAYLEGDELARLDPTGLALRNVNTPEELAEAERLLARG